LKVETLLSYTEPPDNCEVSPGVAQSA